MDHVMLPPTPLHIACIGEAMIELSQPDLTTGRARIGVAGDTLNTAVYLSRLLPGTVSYLTNLGQDALSAQMLERFAAEGIDCSLIGRHDTRLPGIYAIETDAGGERSFRYWRENSAARTLFSGMGPSIGPSFDDLAQFSVIYLSGITLAILPPEVRSALTARLNTLHDTGTQVVFDSNYRPRLWPDAATARAACAAMWVACSVALPSLDDEQALYPNTTPRDVLDRITAAGVPEIILKSGAAGPLIRHDGTDTQTALPQAKHIIDTTGAGDSFNAGYLAARLTGANPLAAATVGHNLASHVIGYHGGVIARADMPHVTER
jgi:2-dehydro-3-deoxygluconokinase